MLVKDILSQAAFLLGKEELSRYLHGQAEDPLTEEQEKAFQSETEALLRCYNIVENEIALDYLPLTAEETVVCSTGALPYTSFMRPPVSVLSVTDEYGNKMPFTVFPEYLRLRAGTVVVTYSYSPESKRLSDYSDYSTRASERTFAYGVACEYCLIAGLYEEALVWDKKYKDALLCAQSASRPRVIRSRRWV